jgi:hypothetical protein
MTQSGHSGKAFDAAKQNTNRIWSAFCCCNFFPVRSAYSKFLNGAECRARPNVVAFLLCLRDRRGHRYKGLCYSGNGICCVALVNGNVLLDVLGGCSRESIVGSIHLESAQRDLGAFRCCRCQTRHDRGRPILHCNTLNDVLTNSVAVFQREES